MQRHRLFEVKHGNRKFPKLPYFLASSMVHNYCNLDPLLNSEDVLSSLHWWADSSWRIVDCFPFCNWPICTQGIFSDSTYNTPLDKCSIHQLYFQLSDDLSHLNEKIYQRVDNKTITRPYYYVHHGDVIFFCPSHWGGGGGGASNTTPLMLDMQQLFTVLSENEINKSYYFWNMKHWTIVSIYFHKA